MEEGAAMAVQRTRLEIIKSINKGDDEKPNYRSLMVGKELNNR